MKHLKKILIILGILLIIGFIMFLAFSNKNGSLMELKSKEVIEKINNKESFILCLSQTTCSHCQSYKPKLKEITKKYNIDIYYVETNLFTKKEKESFNKYIYISGTPTTVFIVDGKEKTTASRLSGNVSIEKLTSKLKQFKFIK